MMGLPHIRYFKNMVHSILISNYPVIPDDITGANRIYGTNIHYLTGKTVIIQPTLVAAYYINVPPYIIKEHGYVTVIIGVMYFDNLTFVISTCERI